MALQRLRQLRLSRGWSLDALAKQIDGAVSKQALSKYEKGEANPSPEILAQLANALGVSADVLSDESSIDVQFIAYRKKANTPKREQVRIENLVRRQLEQRVELASTIGDGVTDVPVQSLRIRKLEDAETAAATLRRRWDLGREPISNVAALLEDHLVHVLEVEASDRFDGLSALAFRSDKSLAATAVITRSGVAGERQRMNFAHELGHQVLKLPLKLDEEDAAFRFAGAFLAPADVLRREIGSRRRALKPDELFLLKQRFGISIQAILLRLRHLNIINESLYRQWFRELGRLGWRKREPNPVPSEKPQWLRRAVLRAFAEGACSEEFVGGVLEGS